MPHHGAAGRVDDGPPETRRSGTASEAGSTGWTRRIGERVGSWPAWLAVLLVTALLLLVYLPTGAHTHDQNYTDTSATYLAAAQLARDGSLTLDRFEGATWVVETPDGRLVSNRFPGTILYAAAFYLVLGAGSGQVVPVMPAALAAALGAALAMGLLSLLLRRLVAPPTAVGAALVGGLATSTWAISGHALWTHGPAQLLLVGAMLALAAGHHARAGLAMGASILVRPHLAVVPAVTGLHTGWRRRSWRSVLLVGATAALGLVAYLAYNRVVFGGALAAQPGAEAIPQLTGGYGTRWLDNLLTLPPWTWLGALAGALVSPSRGLLTISPFLLALLPGLPAAWRRAPGWVRSAALGGVLYLLLQLRANPAFGAGFGFYVYRIHLETLTLCAPLLVLAWRHWTRITALRRRVFWLLAGMSAAVQTLAVASGISLSDQAQVGWGFTEWRALWEILGWWVPGGLLLGGLLGLAAALVTGDRATDDGSVAVTP